MFEMKTFVGVALLLFATLLVGAQPARAAGCPIVLDRVIETYPPPNDATSESKHLATFTLTFLANVPAFTSIDISGRWAKAKTLAHQTAFALEGQKRPFVSNVFTTYDDRTHGTLLDVWISDVVEKDGTHVTCRHTTSMQRRNDRLFPGAIELVSREALSEPTASEKFLALATPSPTPTFAPSAAPQLAASASPDPSQACPTPDAPATLFNDVPPQYPEMAKQQGASGTTQVLVNVDAAGINRSERIYKSSGNAALDQAALTAARLSTYRPGFAACIPVPGQFLFRAVFSES